MTQITFLSDVIHRACILSSVMLADNGGGLWLQTIVMSSKCSSLELNFLEDGGYGRSPRAPWRAPSIFEDSPICPNFSDPARHHPCKQCLLIDFVPQARRNEDVPCRFIPLNANGMTVDDLYRTGTQIEMEEALAGWLRNEINRIEKDRATANTDGGGLCIIPS